MIVLPMRPHNEPYVRSLYEQCHPGWPEPKLHEFFAYPTLVAVDEEQTGGVILGYAQYWLNTSDAGDLVLYLRDTCIAPEAQGRGLGKLLMNARLDVGREMGATWAAGITQVDNASMLSILTGLGFQQIQRCPFYYKQFTPAKDGVLFMLPLKES